MMILIPSNELIAQYLRIKKRICPGMAYGESIVLAAMLTTLAAANVGHAVDAKGQEIPIDPGTSGKFVECVRSPFLLRTLPH